MQALKIIKEDKNEQSNSSVQNDSHSLNLQLNDLLVGQQAQVAFGDQEQGQNQNKQEPREAVPMIEEEEKEN